MNSPGKFQGEKPYVPYLWETMIECGWDEALDDEANQVRLFITDADVQKFPELSSVKSVILREDDNGFVYCTAEYNEPDWYYNSYKQ